MTYLFPCVFLNDFSQLLFAELELVTNFFRPNSSGQFTLDTIKEHLFGHKNHNSTS